MTKALIRNTTLAVAACAVMATPTIAAAGGPGLGPANLTNGNPCANNLCGGGAWPQPPKPQPNPPAGGFGAGVAVGLVGAAIVNGMMQPRQPQIIVQQPVEPAPVYTTGYPEAHVRYCLENYQSYIIATNHYTAYSGVQKPCISPFM